MKKAEVDARLDQLAFLLVVAALFGGLVGGPILLAVAVTTITPSWAAVVTGVGAAAWFAGAVATLFMPAYLK